MKHPATLVAIPFAALLASCTPGGDAENYDTGYDTSDPYGNPAGYDSAPYQAVNPPADPSYGSAAYEETSPVTPAAPPVPSAPSAPVATASTHVVAKGDTLWGLSRKYGVSVDAIRAANAMGAADNNIRLGQTINIPAR